MYALAEGCVDGLDDVIRVRLREIAQRLERSGRGLCAFFDAQQDVYKRQHTITAHSR